MRNELNLYRVTCIAHRHRGKKRRREVTDAIVAGQTGADAARKRVAHLKDCDPLLGTRDGIEVTAIEQVGTLRRCPKCGELRSEENNILCLCSGLNCERCGERKMHRPISDFYDEAEGEIWHVPWFYTPTLCPDCARPEGDA